MLKAIFTVICGFGLIMLGNSQPLKRKRALEETWKFNPGLRLCIVSDTIIQQYESEHKIMHKKEDGTIDEAEYLRWPAKLGDKNLTEYCRKYLKTIIPTVNISYIFGKPERGRILYSDVGDEFEYNIGSIRCEVSVKDHSVLGKAYHIMEAPEPECVYAIKRIRKGKSPFKIVFKMCGFETNDVPNFIHSKMRFKDRIKTMSKIDPRTGIPIAKNRIIAEYENKHQKMHQKHDGSIDTDKYKAWPLNRNETFLSNFCANYLQVVIPKRVKNNCVSGEYDVFVLQYTQTTLISLKVGIIKCAIPSFINAKKDVLYYITESSEPDCVYTLLRSNNFPVCKIVCKICGIKNDEGLETDCEPNSSNPFVDVAKEWESKSDLNPLGNIDRTNPLIDDTEEYEMKLDIKTLPLFSTN